MIPADPCWGSSISRCSSQHHSAVLIDALIGVSLLSRKTKYITWAIVRAVVE